jgi:hypothetical protein
LTRRPPDDSDEDIDFVFMTVHNWGENPAGKWIVEVCDNPGNVSDHRGNTIYWERWGELLSGLDAVFKWYHYLHVQELYLLETSISLTYNKCVVSAEICVMVLTPCTTNNQLLYTCRTEKYLLNSPPKMLLDDPLIWASSIKDAYQKKR